MKLTYFQLAAHLASHLASVYIISGDEFILKNDALRLIRKKAKQTGFLQRIRLTQETGLDEGNLYSILNANSLMQEKQLIECDFKAHLPSQTTNKILDEYGKHPSPENILLIDINKVDNKILKNAWFQTLAQIGVLVTIWPLSKQQFLQWIKERAQKYKLNLEPDAAQLLAEQTEGNLAAAAQYIEKIYLLDPLATITTQTIASLLTNESHYTIFDLIDSFTARNTSRSLRILHSLKNEKVEPILILWGIARELRLLAELSAQVEQGKNLSALFQEQRVKAYRQSSIRQWITKYSTKECWNYLLQASEVDQILKGAVSGNAWQALELLCLNTSGNFQLNAPYLSSL